MNTDCFHGVWITICLQATDTKAKNPSVCDKFTQFIHSFTSDGERKRKRENKEF